MRLRRACCNPALVDPKIAVPGAKLVAFLDLVEELRANRHKALVFSQFTGHLELVRAALDERGVELRSISMAARRPPTASAVWRRSRPARPSCS